MFFGSENPTGHFYKSQKCSCSSVKTTWLGAVIKMNAKCKIAGKPISEYSKFTTQNGGATSIFQLDVLPRTGVRTPQFISSLAEAAVDQTSNCHYLLWS